MSDADCYTSLPILIVYVSVINLLNLFLRVSSNIVKL